MSRCQNHWRGQHKFEARIDSTPADRISMEGFVVRGEENRRLARDMFVRQTYVRDVCVRCGEAIERAK